MLHGPRPTNDNALPSFEFGFKIVVAPKNYEST
jgi:hypothetical protein